MSSVIIAGNTSGTITLDAPNVAGTTTLTLPTTSGTITTKDTNGIISVNGVQFPATQSPSADANCLDDYEEGTWTPNQGAGLTVVGAFSSSGTYTKVGRVVTIHAQFTAATSILISAANLTICTNLPFPLANIASYYPDGMGMNNNSNAVYGVYGNLNSSTVTSLVAFASSTGLSINLTYFTTT
jgi:hypothetical protein